MEITPAVVREEYRWTRDRAPAIADQVNETRRQLGELFDVTVGTVEEKEVVDAVDAVFADGAVAVNVAAYVRLLRDLDVTDDYPGFVVDEVLGRRLAATIAGGQPLALLAEATFHFADATGPHSATAGGDDLDAALAAGFQSRLPGWSWQETDPFAVADAVRDDQKREK